MLITFTTPFLFFAATLFSPSFISRLADFPPPRHFSPVFTMKSFAACISLAQCNFQPRYYPVVSSFYAFSSIVSRYFFPRIIISSWLLHATDAPLGTGRARFTALERVFCLCEIGLPFLHEPAIFCLDDNKAIAFVELDGNAHRSLRNVRRGSSKRLFVTYR